MTGSSGEGESSSSSPASPDEDLKRKLPSERSTQKKERESKKVLNWHMVTEAAI